jgi:hypothetical protein
MAEKINIYKTLLISKIRNIDSKMSYTKNVTKETIEEYNKLIKEFVDIDDNKVIYKFKYKKSDKKWYSNL